MRREIFFLIGRGGQIIWADSGTGPFTIPDSRARWLAIWEHQANIEEIAHSHPYGPLAFSFEDQTTIEAIDQAFGASLQYAVVTPDAMIRRRADTTVFVEHEPWWANILRAASGMNWR